jgi:glycerol uptake facilitator-like aquaporin
MDKRWRAYLAETVGTFLIVFLGGAAVCASLLPTLDDKQPRIDLWGIALAEGCALAVVLPIVFRESPGCLNPAITLALWVCKRLDGRETGILIGLQLLGSLLAGMVLRAIFPEEAIRFATPHLQQALLDEKGLVSLVTSVPLGVVVEALLTFAITFAVFGLLIDRRAPRYCGFGVGLIRAAVVLAGYNLTGAAANPARWFGPAVWQLTVTQLRQQSVLGDHPAYWVGPVLGALAAGMLYVTFLLPPEQAKEATP